ncbi:MAG: FG-GAP repeat protein, partial [Planctomycetota bacterium]
DLNDRYGSSVSISGDYAVVGAPYYAIRGSAFIFERDETSWIQQDMLYDPNVPVHSYLGDLVSISDDYAIMAGDYVNRSGSDYGPVCIFKRDDTNWTEQAMLSSLDNSFGRSISISSEYAVVGAHEDDTDNHADAGSVHVFKREDTNWTDQTRLIALDNESFDHFGSSVSIKGDYVIVGAPDDDDHYMGRDSGSAYIFELDGTEWTQRAKLTALDAGYDDFLGTSVAVDGDYAIVGAPGDDDNGRESGAVYVFKRIGSVWTP